MKKAISAVVLAVLAAGCASAPTSDPWDHYSQAHRCEPINIPAIDTWVSRAGAPRLEKLEAFKCRDRYVWRLVNGS